MDDNAFFDFLEESSKRNLVLDSERSSVLPVTYLPWHKIIAGLTWSKYTFNHDGKAFDFITKSYNDFDTQDATHTFCYICNTLVPNAYVLEHVNSSKHMSFQKIAMAGLEKARKYKQMIGKETTKNSLEYFCEHCVSVINLSNQNEHEKSKTHKTSAALDVFVNNFALFYASDGNGDIDPHIAKPEQYDSDFDIALLKINGSEELKIEQNADFDVVTLNINDNIENISSVVLKEASAIKDEPKDPVNENSATVSCSDKSSKEMNNNITTEDKHGEVKIAKSLEQYIKWLKKFGKANLRTFDAFNQHLLKIITTDDTELAVSTINFHGFKWHRVYTECKLCDTNVKNITRHRLFETHMKIVAQPFEDKHCIRRLREPFSHCVLCNEIIDNAVVHVKFSKHLRKLHEAIELTKKNNKNTTAVNLDDNVAVNPVNTERDSQAYNEAPNVNMNNKQSSSSETNYYYCPTCDRHMHIKSAETHLTGTRHIMNSKSLIYYLMSETQTNLLTCKVCHIEIRNSMRSAANHVATPAHVDNYNNYLAANNIVKTNYYLYCKPCEKLLPVTNEFTHIECTSHSFKLAIYNKNVGNKDHVKAIENKHGDVKENTEISKKHIEKGLPNKDDTIADPEQHSSISYDHKDTLKKQKIKDNNCIPKDSGTIFNNETKLSSANHCDEELLNNSSDITVNNDIAIKKTLDELLPEVNNLLEDLLKCLKSPPEIHSHLQLTEVENILNCVVCRDKISVEDTEKHTSSLKHIHAHRDLLTVNKLRFKKENYVCYVCRINVETGKELRHIESVQHEMRIDSLKKGEYVLVTMENKQLIDKIYHDLKVLQSEHDQSESKDIILEDINIINVTHHFCDLIDNEKQLICVLCEKLIENKDCEYRTHVDDINHLMNYKILMTYNQMFQIDDSFVCGFCECIVDGNVFAHISSEEHIVRHKNDPERRFCFSCKVSTADMDLKEHITSETHIENIASDFYCNYCNVQIKNNEPNIRRHYEGFEHIKNYTMIDNARVDLEKKNCVCQVCEIAFSRDELRDHISSLNHIMLLHHNHFQELEDDD